MRKPKFVDIVVLLEMIYVVICSWRRYSGKLDELPNLFIYTMIALSICGIAYVWYKYKAKEYTNGGMVSMIIVLPMLENILLIQHL